MFICRCVGLRCSSGKHSVTELVYFVVDGSMGYIKRLIPILLFLDLCHVLDPHLAFPRRILPRVLKTRNFVEMFAGDKAVTKGLRLLGYHGDAIDVRFDSRHDLLTPTGFLLAIALVWGTAKFGVLWLAPPCSTWVWLSRSSTGRRPHRPAGDEHKENVMRQNMLVGRLCYLINLAWHLGVYFIIEQPASTVMFSYPRLQKLLARMGSAVTWVKIEMGCFNLEMAKNTLLVGWAPHLAAMGRRMSSNERAMMRSAGGKKKKTSHHWTDGGKKRSRGGRDLKATQSYPMGFGCHHALQYERNVPVCDPTDDDFPGLVDSDTESDSSIPHDDPCLADIINGDPYAFQPFDGASQLDNEVAVPLVCL